MAARRTRSPNDHLRKAIPPASRYSCCFVIACGLAHGIAIRRRSQPRSGHVDNPGDAHKFIALAAIVSRKRGIVAHTENSIGGSLREQTSPKKALSAKGLAAEELARSGAADAEAKRHPAGALCARSRADHADQEHSRRPVLHHLPHRARGRSRRHRLRRLDGRHEGRGADADQWICHARQRAGVAGGPEPGSR